MFRGRYMEQRQSAEFHHVYGHGRNPGLAAYQSVSAHSAVTNADPHGLVQILMDAAITRMMTARTCIERGEITRKATLLHSAVILIAELRGNLDLTKGGPLAQNLSDLYEYLTRRLIHANLNSDAAAVTEALSLLDEIRGAWVAIGAQVRQQAAPAVSAA